MLKTPSRLPPWEKFAKNLSLKVFGNAVEEPVQPGVGDRAKGRERYGVRQF
jgi:hypothetical protein